MQHAEIKQVYLVDSDDVGKKRQSLDLCCNKVCIQLLVIKLVLSAKEARVIEIMLTSFLTVGIFVITFICCKLNLFYFCPVVLLNLFLPRGFDPLQAPFFSFNFPEWILTLTRQHHQELLHKGKTKTEKKSILVTHTQPNFVKKKQKKKHDKMC